jgi:hypothetical protein
MVTALSTGQAGAGVLDSYSYNGRFLVDSFSGGDPVGGSFDDGRATGGADLQDGDNDGVYDRIALNSTKTQFNTMVGLQGRDTDGDGVADYVGPGGLGTLLASCGGYDPDDPMWVPLAFTSATTKSVVLDLDGDGQPDPEFLPGPPLARVQISSISVPALGEWGLLLLVLSLATVSLRFLRLRA